MGKAKPFTTRDTKEHKGKEELFAADERRYSQIEKAICDAAMSDSGCTMTKVPNREKRLAIKGTVPKIGFSVSAGLVVWTPVAIAS
jgi:hypothetical protein